MCTAQSVLDKNEFAAVLRTHAARYPLMQPQDYGKLAFQSEFGPEHMVADREKAAQGILQEWAQGCGQGARAPEPLGNGLARFYLGGDVQDGALLAQLFWRTAQTHTGTQQGLQQRLALCAEAGCAGMDAWLAAYRARGCPALHHSEAYREAYRPHYRVIREEYARFFPALAAIGRAAQSGQDAVIAIDGRCGSGKTTLAALASELFPCNVFHMDDFYLPLAQRAADWERVPAGNMDLERFLREVLLPASRGDAVRYRPYQCREGRYLPAQSMAPKRLTLVEGSYSHHPRLAGCYTARLFLTCSAAQQAQRLRAREGAYYEAFQTRWIPLEERYFTAYDIEKQSSLALDTGSLTLE